MSSSTARNGAAGSSAPSSPSNRGAGFTRFLSSCRSYVQDCIDYVVPSKTDISDLSIVVCGLSVKQSEVEHTIKTLARRVKKLEAREKSMKQSGKIFDSSTAVEHAIALY